MSNTSASWEGRGSSLDGRLTVVEAIDRVTLGDQRFLDELRGLPVVFHYHYLHRQAFTMATPAEVPRRVAPAAIILRAVSRSRMPPDAFTPNSEPTVSRIKRT